MRTLVAHRALLRPFYFAIAALFVAGAGTAQDGQDPQGEHGRGHDQWHGAFYQKLTIPGSKTSCCNLSDCRPTKIRTNGDHYEIMKDGRWIRVDHEKIVKEVAPDGGAHICAPDSAGRGYEPDYVFCIVMPLES